MANISLQIPEWFLNLMSGLLIAHAIISLVHSYYSFKLHKARMKLAKLDEEFKTIFERTKK